MKKLFLVFLLLYILTCFSSKLYAAQWELKGTAGFSAGAATYSSIAVDGNNVPYVVYMDGGNSNKATVMKFVNGSWSVVGTAGFSAGTVSYTSIAIDSNNVPYVVYSDRGSSFKATVMKFVNGSWTVVGTAGFSAGNAFYTSIAIDGNNVPYVVYNDGANADKATVMKFINGSWTVVGTAGFTAGYSIFTSIAIDKNNIPYVVYRDFVQSNKATVMKFINGSWTVVGTAGFSAGLASYTSIAIDGNNVPYVVYLDNSKSAKATVMKFVNGSWSVVGIAGFSAGVASYTSIAIDSKNVPYVVYVDGGNSNKASVMKFANGSWTVVGNAGFSAGTTSNTAIAIDRNNFINVCYGDGSNSFKATVMKYETPFDYDISANAIVSPKRNISPSFIKYPINQSIRLTGTYTNKGLNAVNKFKAIYKIYNSNAQIAKEGYIDYDDQIPPYTTINPGETVEVDFNSFFKTNVVGEYKMEISSEWALDQGTNNNVYPRNDSTSYTFEVQYDIQLAANKILTPMQGEKLLAYKPITPIAEFINKGVSPVSNIQVGMIITKLSNNTIVYNNLSMIQDLNSGRFNSITMDFEALTITEPGNYKVCTWIYDAEDPVRSDDTTCITFEIIPEYDISSNAIVSPRRNIAPSFAKYPNNYNIKLIGTYTNKGIKPVNKFKAIYKIYSFDGQLAKEGFVDYDDQIFPFTTINPGETVEVDFNSFFKTNVVGVYKMEISSDWTLDQSPFNNIYPRSDSAFYTFEVQYDIQLAANNILIPAQGEKLLSNKFYTPKAEFINKGVSAVSNIKVGIIITKLSNGEVVYSNVKVIEDLNSGKFNTISMDFGTIVIPENGNYKACTWIYDADDPVRSDDTTCVTFEVIKPNYDLSAKAIISPKRNTAPFYVKYLNNSNIKLLGSYTNQGLNPVNKFKAIYKIYNPNGQIAKEGFIDYDDQFPPYTTIQPGESVEVDFNSFFKTTLNGIYRMEISSEWALDQGEYNNVYPRVDSSAYTFEVQYDIQVATNNLLIPQQAKKLLVNSSFVPRAEFINEGISTVSNVNVGMKVTKLSNNEVVYLNTKIIEDLSAGRFNTLTMDFASMLLTETGMYKACSWISEPDDIIRTDDTVCVNFELILRPAVSSVSVPISKSYLENEELIFTVNWNESVAVTGTPKIELSIGSATKYATYQSGDGTSALVFSYFVENGDLDVNGIEVGSLLLNNGTIKYDNSIDVDLTLNSIGSTTGVLVGVTAPELRTDDASNVSVNTATINGEVTSDGYAEITTRGFVISTTQIEPNLTNATIHNDNTNAVGLMSKNLTGLTSSKLYYYRAYASNSQGTSYGDVLTFTTLAPEPTRQTKNITFYKIGKNVLGLKFAKGNGANRIIIASTNSLPDANYLQDGKNYSVGVYGTVESEISDTYVVYNSNGAIFDVIGLLNNTTYFFRIFDYNGANLTANYNLTSGVSNPRSNKTLKKEADEIEDISTGYSLNIYPNPAKDNINLELNLPFDSGEMIIVDNEGRELYKSTNLTSFIKLDISSFVNGTYHILISNGDAAIYNSFVIEK